MKAPAPTLRKRDPCGEGLLPTAAQVIALTDLLSGALPEGWEFLVDAALRSRTVTVRLRGPEEGQGMAVTYAEARVAELGDRWPGEVADALLTRLAQRAA